MIGGEVTGGEMSAETILVVDDDAVFRERLARALRARGYTCHTAADGAAARALMADAPAQMAIIDLRMPEENGLALLQALRVEHPDLRAVILTGYGSIATAVDAIRLGAVNYVAKPAGTDDILAAFERAESPPLTATDHYASQSLARAEWEHINRVLADCNGNISEAARRLGIHRRSLQRKLQKYPPTT